MGLDYGSALGFLRTVLRGVEERAIFFNDVTTEYLRSEDRVWALPSTNGTVVFTRKARDAYESLTEGLVADCPGLDRGIAFRRIRHELFRMMSKYVGTDPASLQAKNVADLQNELKEWFDHEAEPREVFLPCAISPWPAPPFSIGPIRFTFINDVRQADFYVSASALVREHDFGKILERMQRDRGSWLAQAKVEGCDQARGEEIGALAIDLALVMLQLALPTSWNTRNISRLDARRGGADSQIFSRTATTESGSHSSHDAGVTIGEGMMPKILQDFSKLANAVGTCVTAFASGRFQSPNLQRSFCDAAYWFHEALAEKIDSIAIVKLETSLEVLLRPQSSKASQARIRSVLEAFYGLASKDPVVPGSTQTADDFAKSIVGDRSQFLHGTLPCCELPYRQTTHLLPLTERTSMPFESAEAFRHFVASVKHDRRYIYSAEVISFLDAVEETAQSRIKTIPKGIHLWRAQLGATTRLQDEGQPEEMEVDVPLMDARMKPIPALVGDGRANPRGVAYLYLADTTTTAASELRPWLGALLSISQFHVNRELRIVDCTSDKKMWMKGFDPVLERIIPWSPEDYEAVVWGDIGEAMSRPYSPEESSLNYVPTQIIAERLRHGGVDGMAYNSLLAKGGQNFVLFDIKDADPVNFTLYEADQVTYTITQCDNTYFNRRKPAAAQTEHK